MAWSGSLLARSHEIDADSVKPLHLAINAIKMHHPWGQWPWKFGLWRPNTQSRYRNFWT